MRKLAGITSIMGLACLAACTPPAIGLSVPLAPSSSPAAGQLSTPICSPMDAGAAWTRPCHNESPLLTKTAVNHPSLDGEAIPVPGAYNPVNVTAQFVLLSPTAPPDYANAFTLAAVTDVTATGIARGTDGNSALKVESGWDGHHRILYYTIETETGPGQVADVSGSKTLPDPIETGPQEVKIVIGAVQLAGQNYDVTVIAQVPTLPYLTAHKSPSSKAFAAFPAEQTVPSTPGVY